MQRLLDLFSGIGGFSLGLEQTGGFETVAFCEREVFPTKILKRHWPGVPIYDDVKTLTDESLRNDGIGVDAVCAGFPCQPFSNAGKRLGTEDDRHLWPEVVRILDETNAPFFIGENVGGITSMVESRRFVEVESRTGGRTPDGYDLESVLVYQERMLLDSICEDLERLGYEVQPVIIPACAVGARHRRDRIFILAHAERKRGNRGGTFTKEAGRTKPSDRCSLADAPGSGTSGNAEARVSTIPIQSDSRMEEGRDAPFLNTEGNGSAARLSGRRQLPEPDDRETSRSIDRDCGPGRGTDGNRGEPESGLGGGFDGVPTWLDGRWELGVDRLTTVTKYRADRLKTLGNAIVPEQARAVVQPLVDLMGWNQN